MSLTDHQDELAQNGGTLTVDYVQQAHALSPAGVTAHDCYSVLRNKVRDLREESCGLGMPTREGLVNIFKERSKPSFKNIKKWQRTLPLPILAT